MKKSPEIQNLMYCRNYKSKDNSNQWIYKKILKLKNKVMALNSQQWARKKIADGLVQQCTFPTIFMQKLEKSTPGLLWVNTTPNRYYSYNISLESAYCPLKEALWISVHPLHVYSMFPSPLKYQYCLLPAILLIPFLCSHPTPSKYGTWTTKRA